MATSTLLREFIPLERERYGVYDNNIFALALLQVSRYYDFLSILLRRYDEASAAFRENFDAFNASMVDRPSSGRLTQDQMNLLSAQNELSTLAHLEVESFYVFAKLLLDRIALFINRYFGVIRGLELRSHDRLVKHFTAYAIAKGLTLPDSFVPHIHHLKEMISDFRDKQIAHAHNLRTIRGTGIDPENRVILTSTTVYPKDTDSQATSRNLHELMAQLDEYLVALRLLIESNRARTCLKLR